MVKSVNMLNFPNNISNKVALKSKGYFLFACETFYHKNDFFYFFSKKNKKKC